MNIDLYAISNVGRVRKNNEDCFFVNGEYRKNYKINDFSSEHKGDSTLLEVYAVFDGMGGIQFGEEASGAAAESLNKYYNAILEEKMDFNIEMAIRKINNGVCKAARKISAHSGSTIVLTVINDDKMQIANVGDSRAYLYRDNKLKQITIDHNEAEMYKEMQLDIQIPNSKNVLTQHLGIEEDDFVLEPFVSDYIKLQKKDIVLLCSDGLCGFVSDEEISKIIDTKYTVKSMSKELLSKALEKGGNDNITILMFGVN